jgi:hypothetical protein
VPTRDASPPTRRSTYHPSSDRTSAAPRATTQPAVATAYSSETGRTYSLDRLIGKGGFGEVYLATPTPSFGVDGPVCVKISNRLSGWLR